jgi:hypothetical protein
MPLKLLCEKNGQLSLKRIISVTCVGLALLGKIALNIYAATHINIIIVNFSSIDNSLDNLLYAGIGLLFGTVFEKFTRHDKQSSMDRVTRHDKQSCVNKIVKYDKSNLSDS